MMEISEYDIERFKKALIQCVLSVKHSHRVEAMARGLGFNTYAALRSEITDGGYAEVSIDPAKFEGFILERGYGFAPGKLADWFGKVAPHFLTDAS